MPRAEYAEYFRSDATQVRRTVTIAVVA